jgi:dephospho-CoA kinase
MEGNDLKEDTLSMSSKKKAMLFPISKEDREKFEKFKSQGRLLLVGLTGGIASGKSTVAQFLKEEGGVIVDFDILARNVVRPGEKAWRGIVEFFGEGVLLADRELDRKRLSEIVFSDNEKRKKLEGFTHPAIAGEFVKEVEKIASEKKGAIVFAVIPLLVEGGMQELFHSVVVVHVPGEKQVQRLMDRDGITKGRALAILKAQMPIEEKLGYADFVIENDGSLEETKRQVKGLWAGLGAQQKAVDKQD